MFSKGRESDLYLPAHIEGRECVFPFTNISRDTKLICTYRLRDTKYFFIYHQIAGRETDLYLPPDIERRELVLHLPTNLGTRNRFVFTA